MKNETKKLSYIEGIGSIVINVILFILKYWVGIMTGSIAIIVDAWHT
jgi:divalent metal cation (Fe/Co/Zn/Cd) transporter